MQKISRSEAISLGVKHYFTGKKCPNGHVSLRFVSSFACVDCAQMHKRNYRKDPVFRQKELAYKKEYNSKNREKNNLYAYKRWRESSETRLRSLERSRKNKEKRNLWCRENYAKNIEAQRERIKRWQKENIDYFRAKNNERRARLKGASGSHTRKDVEKILNLQRFLCANCRSSVMDGYHVDHVIPISKGGSNGPENLQILCPPCNIRKRDKDPIEWAKQNGRLI